MMPAALALAVIGTAARKLWNERRPGAYTGRHRADGFSTMELVDMHRPHLSAALTEVTLSRGMRLPAPRSPWGTPEALDEWMTEVAV